MSADQMANGGSSPEKPSALQQFLQSVRDVSNSHHMAPIHALVRQGADEIAQILPAFPDSVKSAPETGQIFEPTMQEVYLNKTGRELDVDMGK